MTEIIAECLPGKQFWAADNGHKYYTQKKDCPIHIAYISHGLVSAKPKQFTNHQAC